MNIRTSAAEFVKVWNTSNSVHEVAARTGMTIQSAYTRGWKLRKERGNLKRFTPLQRGGNHVKVKRKQTAPPAAAAAVPALSFREHLEQARVIVMRVSDALTQEIARLS